MIDFRFRKVEVIIFSIYIGIAVISSICSLCHGNSENAIAPIIMAPLIVMALVIEHKKQLIFNRETNKFTVVEKALFRNEYKVNKQLQLDDIIGANVYSYISRSKNGSTTMYELHINSRTEGTIKPLNSASSVSSTATNFANQINTFLAGNEPSLTINHAPCFARVIGIIFSFFYFTICYACMEF